MSAPRGRKPLPPTERRERIQAFVSPETAAWLEARSLDTRNGAAPQTPGRGIGRVIDDLVAAAMGGDDPAEY